MPIQGHPTMPSRTFLWCPGSSENLFELDIKYGDLPDYFPDLMVY